MLARCSHASTVTGKGDCRSNGQPLKLAGLLRLLALPLRHPAARPSRHSLRCAAASPHLFQRHFHVDRIPNSLLLHLHCPSRQPRGQWRLSGRLILQSVAGSCVVRGCCRSARDAKAEVWRPRCGCCTLRLTQAQAVRLG